MKRKKYTILVILATMTVSIIGCGKNESTHRDEFVALGTEYLEENDINSEIEVSEDEAQDNDASESENSGASDSKTDTENNKSNSSENTKNDTPNNDESGSEEFSYDEKAEEHRGDESVKVPSEYMDIISNSEQTDYYFKGEENFDPSYANVNITGTSNDIVEGTIAKIAFDYEYSEAEVLASESNSADDETTLYVVAFDTYDFWLIIDYDKCDTAFGYQDPTGCLCSKFTDFGDEEDTEWYD